MAVTTCIIIWAVAFVFFVIVEIANGAGLLSIWCAIASLISLLCAVFGMPFVGQFAVFVAASIILLIATRPVAKKVQNKVVPTNFELDVGKTAEVTEDIDNTKNKGRVKLDGTYWAAVSQDGSFIKQGSVVSVVEVSGAKLIVAHKN